MLEIKAIDITSRIFHGTIFADFHEIPYFKSGILIINLAIGDMQSVRSETFEIYAIIGSESEVKELRSELSADSNTILLFDHFDANALWRALRARVDACCAGTYEESRDRLRRQFVWEYD